MNDLLNALLLGIIEGITEFLPVSSTGHLLIAEHWLGQHSELFNVCIQSGAILAVVFIYWKRLCDLLLGFAKPTTNAVTSAQKQDGRDYATKLAVSFLITAVLGLIVKKFGAQLPETLAPVAWALVIGGLWMLAAEWLAAKHAEKIGERSRITWAVAILVGIAQVVAGVFPGTSRSAATIFVALLAGTTSRAAATEFAFLVGIPTMFAASAFEALKIVKDGGAQHEDWAAFAVAFVVSAITAFVAVKWLLRYIQSHRFTWFAIYRIALGAALLVLV